MIVSVSRRTDIPAFYGEWFLNRIREGFFQSINPFNPNQRKEYSLEVADIEALIFWTKNPEPFLKQLHILEKKGYRYYFQFTLNDYPRIFESRVPEISKRIDVFRRLSNMIGSERVVWRFDPIIISSITPVEYIAAKIDWLAKELSGYSKRLVISFMDFYGKVNKKVGEITRKEKIFFSDLAAEEHRRDLIRLCREIGKTASRYKFEVFTCAENLDLTGYGIRHGSCIDADLINRLFGLNLKIARDRRQRKACRCAESVDVGVYNTCSFRCMYCYANAGETALKQKIARHDVLAPALIP